MTSEESCPNIVFRKSPWKKLEFSPNSDSISEHKTNEMSHIQISSSRNTVFLQVPAIEPNLENTPKSQKKSFDLDEDFYLIYSAL